MRSRSRSPVRVALVRRWVMMAVPVAVVVVIFSALVGRRAVKDDGGRLGGERHALYADTSLHAGVRFVIAEAREVFGEETVPSDESFFVEVKERAVALAAFSRLHAPDILIDTLLGIVYGEWRIAFDPNPNDLGSVLPHTVLARKRGSCLGVSLTLLILAEEAGIPLQGVHLPGHFFVRYEAGGIRRNIEPNRGGFSHPDLYYRQSYGIGEQSRYDLRNLSRWETLAVLHYNVGNVYSEAGRVDRAIGAYRRCLALNPDFPEAWGNLAIALSTEGSIVAARDAFRRAGSLDAELPHLAANLGAFELRQGRPGVALEAYCRGLQRDPSDVELRQGAEAASRAMGRSVRGPCSSFEHAEGLSSVTRSAMKPERPIRSRDSGGLHDR